MKIKSLPIIAGVFIAVVMAVQFAISYYRETQNMLEWLDYELEVAQQTVLFKLYDLHDAAGILADCVKDEIKTPGAIKEETLWVLKRNPDITGCYVNFVPNYYPKKGKFFCVSSFYKNDSIITGEFGGEQHDYFQREWYVGAMQCDENGYWTQSYRDEDSDEMIFTHSVKVETEGEEIVGVVGLDFSIAWTKHVLETIKPSKRAICRLYSSAGLLVASTDNNDHILNDNNYEWIISRRVLSPMDMKLVIAVPKTEIVSQVGPLSAITFALLFFGLALLGWMLHRIRRNEQQYANIQAELQVANKIQQSILPHDMVKDERLEVKGTLIPAREVGGDLYDYIVRGDDLFFIIGDVSGKGMPAAIYMSATVKLFRSAVLRLDSPKAIMEEINTILSANNPGLTFVTAFIGKIHISTGEMRYCNAGHLPPIRENGEMIEVEPNIPLGYDGRFHFVEQKAQIGKDKLLVLCTDGITEARNPQHQLLGMKRWKEIVGRGGDLLQPVQNFMADAEQTDDITLLTILCKSTLNQTVRKP